jgi:fluoroquinolone resistance protein
MEVYQQHFTYTLPENQPPAKGEYEQCTFTGASWGKAHLAGYEFRECSFVDCDLSMANVKGTSFADVTFKQCKLLGMRFEVCHPFLLSFAFEQCVLDFASFYRLKLKGQRFTACQLRDVEFTEADLSKAHFTDCDLSRALFDGTNLTGADFTTAAHFSINPELNNITDAHFSAHNVGGLLHKYRIHIL